MDDSAQVIDGREIAMNLLNKIFQDKSKLILVLIFILSLVSVVQGIFLVKLFRAADQKVATSYLNRDHGNSYGLYNSPSMPFDFDNWDPFDDLQSMQDQMDRLFNTTQNRFMLSPFFDKKDKLFRLFPQTDLEEKSDRYIVTMNIPGSKEAKINVSIENNVLSVSAETIMNREKKEGSNFLKMERRTGIFQRSLTLPGPVKGTMETKYKDGVLTIILPKKD